MPNGNVKHEVQCPNCGEKRMVRSDVLSKLQKEAKPLICKPCHNRLRFDGRDHPRKGAGGDTGILTPANLGSATTITFNAVGDSATLQFAGTDWWVVGFRGAVVA
jgi:predicted RNA-binding Zn-ribbon protein involved in translation (DUF1610 family)